MVDDSAGFLHCSRTDSDRLSGLFLPFAPLNQDLPQDGARLTQDRYSAGAERSHPCSPHRRLILCRRDSKLSG